MHKTTQNAKRLQLNFDESPVKSRRNRLLPVQYEFVPIPEYIEKEIPDARLEKLFRIILRMLRRGTIDPPLRLLAHYMKKSIRTVQRYIRALVELGKLAVTERRIARHRNLSNVFSIPELHRGVGDKTVVEKKGEDLKTKTTATERGGEKSPLQKLWEARFAQDRKDSNWKRAQYEQKAREWAESKRWQLQQAYQRTYMAMQACVGVYRGE